MFSLQQFHSKAKCRMHRPLPNNRYFLLFYNQVVTIREIIGCDFCLSSDKVTLSADSLQQLLLQQQQVRNINVSTCRFIQNVVSDTVLDSRTLFLKMMQSQLLGPGALQRLKETEQQPGDYQALKARIIQLEGQVR